MTDIKRRATRGKNFRLVEQYCPEENMTPERWSALAQTHKTRLHRKALQRQTESGESPPAQSSTSDDKPRSKLSTAEARREYQRRYYQRNKEKAKEYQRQYNLTHKKKAQGGSGRGRKGKNAEREVVRTTFNEDDIMHAPMGKTLKLLEKIIKGERLFTMQQ